MYLMFSIQKRFLVRPEKYIRPKKKKKKKKTKDKWRRWDIEKDHPLLCMVTPMIRYLEIVHIV